jgi:hypothetical protein
MPSALLATFALGPFGRYQITRDHLKSRVSAIREWYGEEVDDGRFTKSTARSPRRNGRAWARFHAPQF